MTSKNTTHPRHTEELSYSERVQALRKEYAAEAGPSHGGDPDRIADILHRLALLQQEIDDAMKEQSDGDTEGDSQSVDQPCGFAADSSEAQRRSRERRKAIDDGIAKWIANFRGWSIW